MHHHIVSSSIRAPWVSRSRRRTEHTAATIIPVGGLPRWGATFCTTSAFFGGKEKKFLNFCKTGGELFDVMCEMESSIGAPRSS